MAEPEESPSSLAELEALAGLDGTPAPSTDDGTADDPADFDLSRLAASAAVGADASDTSTDDDRVDLGQGARSADNAATAVPSQALDAVASPTSAPTVAAQVQAVPNAPSGFVWGLVAGIAVAGVLFLLLRTPAAPHGPPSAPATRSSGASVPAPAMSPTSAVTTQASPVAVNGIAPVQAAPTSPSAPVAPVASTSAPRASTTVRPAATNAVATRTGPTQAEPSEPSDADPTRPPTAAPTEAPAAPSRPIDSLLDDALGSGKGAKQAKAAPDNLMGQDLPATPTAADVTQVIQVLLPAIRGCAMGQSGVANTLLVVRNDGGVATASITGAPYAGAASGRCMEGVLRRAKFPRFRQSVFRVQFPLSIRASS